ncbi:MAG: phage holin family protein [Acidobacteriaceae bacterium]|nr:phage holin family protein [Acidobacteriaceae bacterium]
MKKMIAGLPGAILGVFASMPILMKGLIALQVADFITGFLLAWSTGAVSSDVSRKGFVKKAIALLLVIALKVAETVQPMPLELSAYVAGWFCLTELISICENAGKAGLPIPAKLTKVLAQLQEKE